MVIINGLVYMLWSALVGSMSSHVATAVKHEGWTITDQGNYTGRLEPISHMPYGHDPH